MSEDPYIPGALCHLYPVGDLFIDPDLRKFGNQTLKIVKRTKSGLLQLCIPHQPKVTCSVPQRNVTLGSIDNFGVSHAKTSHQNETAAIGASAIATGADYDGESARTSVQSEVGVGIMEPAELQTLPMEFPEDVRDDIAKCIEMLNARMSELMCIHFTRPVITILQDLFPARIEDVTTTCWWWAAYPLLRFDNELAEAQLRIIDRGVWPERPVTEIPSFVDMYIRYDCNRVVDNITPEDNQSRYGEAGKHLVDLVTQLTTEYNLEANPIRTMGVDGAPITFMIAMIMGTFMASQFDVVDITHSNDVVELDMWHNDLNVICNFPLRGYIKHRVEVQRTINQE